jgi:multiple sugar transport system substrate-binding protein
MNRRTGVFLALFLCIPLITLFAGGRRAQNQNYLRFSWWGNTVRDERTLRLVELFKSQNAGIVIDTETTGYDSYWDRLNTQTAAGGLPDVIQFDYDYLNEWVSRNQLLDLTPYIQSGAIDTSKISDAALSSGMINGKVYAVSLGTNVFGMAYDPAVVERAGLTIDSTTWTYRDYEQIATTIYQKTGVQTMPFISVWTLQHMVRQTGHPFMDNANKRLGFTDPAILKEYYDLELRLLDAGVLANPEEALVQGTREEDLFSKGKVWNTTLFSNEIIAAQNAAGRPVKMLLWPRINTNYRQPGHWLNPSMVLTISGNTKNPELAVNFFNFFINDIQANNILLGERGVPIPDDVRASVASRVDPDQKEIFDFVTLAAGHSSPQDPPSPPSTLEIYDIFENLNSQVLTKKISSADAAAQFMTRANQILSGR